MPLCKLVWYSTAYTASTRKWWLLYFNGAQTCLTQGDMMQRQSTRSDDFWRNDMLQWAGAICLVIAVVSLATTGKLDDVIIAAMNSISSCAPQQGAG